MMPSPFKGSVGTLLHSGESLLYSYELKQVIVSKPQEYSDANSRSLVRNNTRIKALWC
jgi:hypothetical protein